MNEKGIMTYDFIIAVMIFITGYIIAMRASAYPLDTLRTQRDPDQIENILISQTITQNPGKPRNWSSINQVQELGLTYYEEGNNPHILDLQKLEEINQTRCSELEEKIPVETSLKIKVSEIESDKTYKCQANETAGARTKRTRSYIWTGEEYRESEIEIQTW